jgi:hypothetical protein
MNDAPAIPALSITRAESKRALALLAHLRQVAHTVAPEGNLLRPTEMDHADLLLCSASLRALLFDGKPVLIGFIKDHGLSIEIETTETNLGMAFLSKLVPGERHVSDMLIQVLLNPQIRDAFPLDQLKQSLFLHEDATGFESISQRPDIWYPKSVENRAINSPPVLAGKNPHQLLDITRRRVSLADWGKVRIGFLKEFAITRRNLVTYVANELGGVHYDRNRLPPNTEDITQFKVLRTQYDWENDAIMHAGLMGVAICCIEFFTNPDILGLLNAMEEFHAKRQGRLIKGKSSPPSKRSPDGAQHWGDPGFRCAPSGTFYLRKLKQDQ